MSESVLAPQPDAKGNLGNGRHSAREQLQRIRRRAQQALEAELARRRAQNPPAMTRRMEAPTPTGHRRESDRPTTGIGALTRRQLRVCLLLSYGTPAKQIASKLDVASRTVEKCKQDAAKAIGLPTWKLLIWTVENRAVLAELLAKPEGGAPCLS